jgi:uncharacterized protein YecE (DUF72 family)
MAVFTGTSGWAYKEWKGSFYPGDLPDGSMLSWYGERLSSVEVNNTFYRMPRREVLEGWCEQVPEAFRFVLKASRRITHQAKLGPDAADALDYLVGNARVMGDRLGAILFQTPPWLKRDVPLLRAFVARIPDGVRGAFEFRSTSWFDDEVYAVLIDANQALVVADAGDPDTDPPLVATADWGYARLRSPTYTEAQLSEWAGRLMSPEWSDLFAFFKHEDEATGPAAAARFADKLAEVAS